MPSKGDMLVPRRVGFYCPTSACAVLPTSICYDVTEGCDLLRRSWENFQKHVQFPSFHRMALKNTSETCCKSMPGKIAACLLLVAYHRNLTYSRNSVDARCWKRSSPCCLQQSFHGQHQTKGTNVCSSRVQKHGCERKASVRVHQVWLQWDPYLEDHPI